MDSYGNFLRRWSLTAAGQFECVHDAVDVTLVSADDRAAIAARNATLHGVRASVEAYEAALRVPEPDEPHEQPVLDDEGQEIGTEPTPAYAAWTAAQAVIAEASDEIKALARIRAGEPQIDEETGDNFDLAVILAEWGEEPEIALPSPADIARAILPPLSPRQLRLVMLQIGLSDADVEAETAAIEDETARAAAMIEWRWATQYDRSHALVKQLASALAFPPEQLDALWIWAAEI